MLGDGPSTFRRPTGIQKEVQLSISEADGTYHLGFVQAAPPANSDALGYDRILVLRFDTDVNADDVKVTFEEAAASAS